MFPAVFIRTVIVSGLIGTLSRSLLPRAGDAPMQWGKEGTTKSVVLQLAVERLLMLYKEWYKRYLTNNWLIINYLVVTNTTVRSYYR